MPNKQQRYREYWKKNIRLVITLMIIWAIPSFICGIFFVKQLNQIQIAGFPLGFWFAQQGAIYVFVILVLTYAVLMDKYDKKYIDTEDDDEEAAE